MFVSLKFGLVTIKVFPETLDEKKFMRYYSDTVREETYRKFAGQPRHKVNKDCVLSYIKSIQERYEEENKGVEDAENKHKAVDELCRSRHTKTRRSNKGRDNNPGDSKTDADPGQGDGGGKRKNT